jgi:glycosyltransferase involved in cell wall biosynthesis
MACQPAMPTRANGRLALFLPDLPVGGVERVFANLASGFVDIGLAVDVVVGDASGRGRAMLPPAANVVDLSVTRTMRALPPLARYLRASRPDVVISGKDHANIVAIVAGRLTKTPVVVTVHGQPSRAWSDPERSTGKLLPRLVRLAYPRATAVVAVSEGVADDLGSTLGIPGCVVIANPILGEDVPRRAEAPSGHSWLDADRDRLVVVWCGRLADEKDPLAAVDAVAEAVRSTPMRLLFVGDGALVDAVRVRAVEHGIQDVVDVVGPVPDALPFLARADVVLLTSRREALPTVLVETLGVGTRVVATDCPTGPRHILRDGALGRLVPVGDPVRIAEGLLDEIASPLREIPPDALLEYTVSAAVERYVRLLAEVSEVRLAGDP